MHTIEDYIQNLNVVRKKLKHLVDISPKDDDIFVCPICFKVFHRGDCKPGIITREHVPPKALGGRVTTFTCKSCNNSSGHELDAALIEEQNFRETMQGVPGAEFDIKYSVNDMDEQLNATFSQPMPNTWNIIGQPKRSNPSVLDKVIRITDGANEDMRMKVSFSLPASRKYMIACLRMGYLKAFSLFGYIFLFHPAIQIVRQQILKPRETIITNIGRASLNISEEFFGAKLIYEPKELQCFMLSFQLKGKFGSSINYEIVLPGLGELGADVYDNFSSLSNNHVEMKFKSIPHDLDFTKAPFAVHEIWKSINYQS